MLNNAASPLPEVQRKAAEGPGSPAAAYKLDHHMQKGQSIHIRFKLFIKKI